MDFRFLIHQRPLWDIVMLVLNGAGALFCFTAMAVGWQRLTGSYRLANKGRGGSIQRGA